ncbi:fused signal recognition particle receptor, partial [Oceanimonas baumannii]
MAKKGFFSWLGFGKKKDEQPEEAQEQQIPQDVVESDAKAEEEARLTAEAQAAEEARLAAEAKAAE